MPRSPKPLANSPKAEDFIVKVDSKPLKPSLCKINPKFPIELVLFFPLALLKAVAMKGSGGPPPSHRRLSLKYRLSHLIKFLSIHSLALILQFLIKKGRLDQRHFPPSPQVDLGNYSQVGSAEKKCEENGAGGEKKEGEEEQTSASEKTKVRRIICPGASHATKFKRA